MQVSSAVWAGIVRKYHFVLIVQGTAARLGTEHMAVYKLVDIVSGMLSLPVVAYASAAQTCALQSRAAGNKKETKYI